MSEEERQSERLKEGKKLVGPSERPDGTFRKPIRIRSGYKRAILKRKMGSAGPSGYEPDADSKPKPESKSKSVKRKQRMKAKRTQPALEKEKNVSEVADSGKPKSLEALTSQVNQLTVQDSPQAQDTYNRIRALRKKIRLRETLMKQKSADQDLTPEQLEKLAKLEDWRRELKLLEDEKGETTGS